MTPPSDAVHAPLIASLAAAGLAAGWIQRAVIVRLAVPADQPDASGVERAARPPALAVGCATAILLGALAARVHPGLIALAGFYLLLLLISPSGMGLGDVKAAASIGTLLAWPSWRLLIAGGFAGFLLAAIYGIALLISGRATRKQKIPFGPFMIAGAFLVILAAPLAGS